MIKDKGSVFIDPKAKIGDNVILCQNVQIEGESVIGENVTVYPNTCISKSIIGKGCKIYSSIIEKTVTGSCCLIGPFTHLKKGTILGGHVFVGPFSVLKNVEVGNYSKVLGSSQIVNANIGENVCVQQGAMFLSESEEKKSIVDDGIVIGAGAKIIAPIKIKSKTVIQPNDVIFK